MKEAWLGSYPAGTPAGIDPDAYPSLVGLFEQSCERFAQRPAYHNLGTTLTFQDLERLSGQFAAYLAGLGLSRGDRVALMMPNVLQYPVALFGVLRAGLTVVNTNPLYTARELRHQLIDSGARCIVIVDNFAHVLEQVIAETAVEHVVITGIGDLTHFPKRVAVNFVVRRIKHLVPPYHLPAAVPFRKALAHGAAAAVPRPPIGPQDIAFLQYTGGTTGVAKGAMLTHRNMVANVMQAAAFWKNILEPGQDVMITPLPMYHVFCLTVDCLLFMQQGGLNVLITNPRDIPAFVQELRKWRMTLITGVDTLFNALADYPGFGRVDFSRLKLGLAGGMPLQARTVEKWRAVTGKDIAEGYGLTEASPIVAGNRYDKPRVGSVGLPVPSTEISIRGDGQNEVPMGEPGELCLRGPQVMAGYWNRPAETRDVISPDGWLRTGDIAVMDPDGYLRIVDRKKDMIIVSGFKVFPNEIESVAAEHPAVLEAGCIGVPDPHSGQVVKVFVVVRESVTITADELHAHFSARLTGYKRPKYLEFRESLPKSNIGKVLRRELAREELAHAA
jgi:long-chain acyl-CoA synthetase